MENFFNWMSKVIPEEEVNVWFSVHNMIYEKIDVFGDIFKSLNQTIDDTYLGYDYSETKITLTQEDKKLHFEWCWDKTIENFNKENIKIKKNGEHKDYFEKFYFESFYDQPDLNVKNNISKFIEDVFDLQKKFTKSDLDILTELYKLMDKNLK